MNPASDLGSFELDLVEGRLLVEINRLREERDRLQRTVAEIRVAADSEIGVKGGPYKNGVSAASKRATVLRRIRRMADQALTDTEGQPE